MYQTLSHNFISIFIQTYSYDLLAKFKVCDDINHCLKQLYSNHHLAIAVSLEHAQSSHFIAKSDIYCFKNMETIEDYVVQILVKPDFPYSNELNAFINMAGSSGLIMKWISDTRNRPDFHFETEHFGSINMENFSGFLILWFSILIVPMCFVLGVERYVYYLAQKSNPSNISVLLEMLIDGQRHFLKGHKKLH